MEKFKAVEKAMKTKAYSKEGLAAAKLDPKEQAKFEAGEFLSGMIDELEQQVEALEAESESLGATMKKGKSQTAKANKMAELEEFIEKHKWHQGKLELIRRSLENGGVEAEQVTDMEESIRYYVSDGMNPDYMGDEGMYDELDLEEDDYGVTGDNDRNSSQDTQSVADDVVPEILSKKISKEGDSSRKASAQTKSPLPALATLHTPLSSTSHASSGGNGSMKPATLPPRSTEGLKYASAAAAAAAAVASSEKVPGLSPLPPPPLSHGVSLGISPLPPVQQAVRTSQTSSPATTVAQPAAHSQSQPVVERKAPTPAPVQEAEVISPVPKSTRKAKAAKQAAQSEASEPPKGMIHLSV